MKIAVRYACAVLLIVSSIALAFIQVLNMTDWVAIGLAMAYAENGQEIDAADVTIGLDLAVGSVGVSLHE